MKIWTPNITKNMMQDWLNGKTRYTELYHKIGYKRMEKQFDNWLRKKTDPDKFNELEVTNFRLYRTLLEFFGPDHWPIRKCDVRMAIEMDYLKPNCLPGYGALTHESAIDWATEPTIDDATQ